MSAPTTPYTVAELVPHSGTMSLLDEIVTFDDESLTARLTITANTLFVTDRGVPAWVGIEYMAQTVSAYAGTLSKKTGGNIKIGFLLGTRKYHCNQPFFPLGATLTIVVQEQLQGDNGLGVFNCQIHGDGIEAYAALNVFQPNDVNEVLQHQK